MYVAAYWQYFPHVISESIKKCIAIVLRISGMEHMCISLHSIIQVVFAKFANFSPAKIFLL